MPGKQVLSVSALTALIKGSLEGAFSSVTVEGEISAAKLSSSGHLYFSLKDKDALIQAVMFKFRLTSLDFELADGQKVVARGSVSVYAARGQYQLIVQSLARSGIGDLLARRGQPPAPGLRSRLGPGLVEPVVEAHQVLRTEGVGRIRAVSERGQQGGWQRR